MSRKAIFIGWTVLIGLVAVVILLGEVSEGQKALAAVGASPASDSSAAWGKPVPAVANAKAHTLISDFGRVPVFFVPNRGQTDGQVDFYVQGNDKTVFFAPDGLTIALEYPSSAREKGEPERWVVKLDFIGSSEGVKPEGLEETGAVISYFSGKPEEWKTGIPAYSKIIYRDLWPGIDLVYKGEIDKLKHEFVVHPGADPSRIRLAYRGAEQVSLTQEGRLEVKTPAGRLEDDIPVAYQENEGKRAGVPVAYSLDGVGENQDSGAIPAPKITPAAGQEGRMDVYGFSVGEYDRSRDMVLDPTVLVYCGYIGGSDNDAAFNIAVDASGNVYVTGLTYSVEPAFPVVVGPDLAQNGDADAFVAKISSSGTSLIYCGYIGGSGADICGGIAVDPMGNAYVAGSTQSSEATFPVTVGPDLTYNGGGSFVAKIDSSGTSLVYCGYIGATGFYFCITLSI